jgi:serine/threonine protein phosphatase PrpC
MLVFNLILDFVQKNLVNKTAVEALSEAYARANTLLLDAKFSVVLSGSTCVSVLINGNKLYSANVGDSRAIICSVEDEVIKGEMLTRDHKLSESDEAKRITSSGGRIMPLVESGGKYAGPLRVWQKELNVPGLAMTRAMGDLAGVAAGIIHEPGMNT